MWADALRLALTGGKYDARPGTGIEARRGSEL